MLQAHERLGDFRIIRLLGKGGMGEVYEALQSNPERPVALKVLAPWLANDEHALQRFWREAKVPAILDHPGIVRIISTGKTEDGVAYYTMHLVRGVSLAELIRRANAVAAPESPTRSMESADTPSTAAPPRGDEKLLPWAPPVADPARPGLDAYREDRFLATARIGVQAARALAYAHGQGHLHRDIKPSNLMVDVHDQVYLVDFGLTRALQPAGDGTQPGAVLGTPWYMSPEQANGDALDERSDIYSLGVTLYELATQGLGPFTPSRDDQQAVLAQVRSGQALPLRTLAPGIPRALEQIILRAMQYRPGRRYGSAAELAYDLAAMTSPNPVSKPPTQSPKRGWSAVVALAGAAMMVAVAAAAIFWPERPQGDEGRKDQPVLAKPAERRPLDGSRAFPESLRDRARALGVPTLLQKVNHAPVWSEPLFGAPQQLCMPHQLALTCPNSQQCAMIALADPDWPYFQFAIQLQHLEAKVQGTSNEMGIVFGWCRDDSAFPTPPRCFMIQVDQPKGRLVIGTACLAKSRAVGGQDFCDWIKPIPDAEMPLDTARKWHELKVLVQSENFSVSIDGQNPSHFSLSRLQIKDPAATENLRAVGAVGIWTRTGTGFFKNANLTMLPAR
jgi:serine/threonine protein kinase